MKRLIKGSIAILFVMTWVLGSMHPGQAKAEGGKGFTDVRGHWAEATILRMSEMGILDGFPDGTFRPEEAVSADQFIKMLLLSYSQLYPNGERSWKPQFIESLSSDKRSVLQQDYRDFSFKPSTVGYWAKPYLDLAGDLNLIAQNQFADYKAKLKREDVAEILYYTIKETEYLEDESFSGGVVRNFGDYLSLTSRAQKYVAEVCAKGIMEGYPNHYFGVGLPVTRAESLVILERLTEKNNRIDMKTGTQSGYMKLVPAADGSYKKLIFPTQRMLDAYDVMLEAAKLRGTNYDMQETVLRLYKDADAKAKALAKSADSSVTWEEASLWLDPQFRTYGVTIRLQDGMLARNEEAIRTFTDYLFGYDAKIFNDLFMEFYSKLMSGESLENRTVTIGDFSVEVRVQSDGKTIVYSILESTK